MFKTCKAISFLILICFSTTAISQSKQDQIQTIRKAFQAINADSKLTKVSLKNQEFSENASDGGALLTGYFRKDTLVKEIEWVGLSYGNRTTEFYFNEGNLIFVYEKFESFVQKNSKTELDYSKTKVSFEGRYYLNKGKIIESKTRGRKDFQDDDSDNGKKLSSEALDDMKKLIAKKKNTHHK